MRRAPACSPPPFHLLSLLPHHLLSLPSLPCPVRECRPDWQQRAGSSGDSCIVILRETPALALGPKLRGRSVEGGGDGAGVAFRGVPLLAERVLLRCPWRRCPDRRSERAGRWAVVSERWAVVSERAGEPPLRGLKSCSHGQRGENQRRPSEHLAASAPRPSAQYSRTRARKTSLHSRLLASVCHLEECWPRWRIGI